jgi:hypothetical protein
MGTKKEIVLDIETHKKRVHDIQTNPKLFKFSYMLETYARLIKELEDELAEKGTRVK